jgi:acyl carrier protein
MSPGVLAYVERRGRLLARVRQVLVEELHVQREASEIDADAPLFGTGLGLDSIDAVELVVTIEGAFRVRFPEGAASRSHLRSVNTLLDFLQQSVPEAAHAQG